MAGTFAFLIICLLMKVSYTLGRRNFEGRFAPLFSRIADGQSFTILAVDYNLIDVGVTDLYLTIQIWTGERWACRAPHSVFGSWSIDTNREYRRRGNAVTDARPMVLKQDRGMLGQ